MLWPGQVEEMSIRKVNWGHPHHWPSYTNMLLGNKSKAGEADALRATHLLLTITLVHYINLSEWITLYKHYIGNWKWSTSPPSSPVYVHTYGRYNGMCCIQLLNLLRTLQVDNRLYTICKRVYIFRARACKVFVFKYHINIILISVLQFYFLNVVFTPFWMKPPLLCFMKEFFR